MSINDAPRILLISPSVIKQDPRVLSHLEVLRKYGDVTTLGYGATPDGVSNHILITDTASYLPKSLGGLLRILLRRYVSAAVTTQFARNALAQTDSDHFDLIVANDVHTLAIAQAIANRTKAKVWADMHEYAPLEGEHDWRWMLIFRRYVKSICLKFLAVADCVTTVGNGIKERFEGDVGREVKLLRNTASYSPRIIHRGQTKNQELSLIHVGVAIRARCLENMIYAVRDVNDVTLDLLILPTDPDYFEEICAIAKRTENVRIVSPIDTDEIVSYISRYDCGVVTIPPTSFNYANGLPNKIFQYIQARLAVITGPIPEVARIVQEFGVGWVTNDFSVEEIRTAILQAKEDGVSSFAGNLDAAASILSKENESKIRCEIVEVLLGLARSTTPDRLERP